MSEAKISQFLCMRILISNTDNVIHFPHLVKQVNVDYVFMIKILIIIWVKQARDHLWLNKTLPNI